MKTIYKLSPLAIAIVALGISLPALAHGEDDGGGAHITNHTHTSYDMDVDGHIKVKGFVEVKSAANATVNNEQENGGNTVSNDDFSKNKATAGSGNLEDTNGNIGVNISNGAGNQQNNSTAISAASVNVTSGDADSGGSADSQVFSSQENGENVVYNHPGTRNTATLGSDNLEDASGNIGVNIANGAGNQQANTLAVSSVQNSVLANASVSSNQHNGGNFV
ncbi:MAG: hypothetical protein KGL58_00620, partial [Pseudomonadota bacterium]|nr:hypothetical protein [Pseudomonadota bacterium]